MACWFCRFTSCPPSTKSHCWAASPLTRVAMTTLIPSPPSASTSEGSIWLTINPPSVIWKSSLAAALKE
jgi:hypothetical protein